ncbi:N-acetylglucosamine-6-phosphate deacetylase [Thalassotalea atypica]|uniref:N-acetylglucosamine-6-phosphate deacetylase n=1 Tax=Thalassotalea atypica TaxID=2054316 RepID=UPI002574179E|nr:N-acetylglucosamine-6-phosphate deacetylase [Thalassotalea atypica]
MITTLIPEQLFDGKEVHRHRPISIEDGKIITFDTVEGAKETKVSGLLVPGFIDVQVNGGGGYLFNHETNVQTLKAMIKAHSQFGTTALLPTLITSDLSTLNCAADVISEARSKQIPGIIGVHFEGPHICVPKKGIHSTDHIRELSQQELDVYCRDDLGIKIVTVAPENVSVAMIKTLVANHVIVCLGHSNASYEQTQAALDAGATGFTHLFNAMSALTSREPNMIGAALLDENSWCGLILDGHHVHPATAKLATQAKVGRKMMLVTDSMSTIGSDQAQFKFDGHNIQLLGDKLTSQTGQLAGSALDMITAVNNAQTMLNVSLEESLRMASYYPAQFLGTSQQQGHLSIGANADFTLLSTTDSPLHVKNTWINGNAIF